MCVYIERISDYGEDDMNKKKEFRWNSNTFFLKKTLLLGKRWHKMKIYPKKKM